MKKNPLCLTLLVSFIISNCLISCKKDAVVARPDCKIVAFIAGINAAAFTYNADGKLSSIIGAAGTDRLTYTGNIITITSTTGSKVNTITTVLLNVDGLASSVSVTDSAGVNLSNTAYEYNGIELNKSTFTSPAGDPVVTTYTWSGGNLVSQNSSNITTYNYSINIPSQKGDVWNNINLQRGYETFRTKNAVTSIESNGNTTTHNYIFDTEGKITSVTTITGGAIFTLNYQYECK